MNARANRPMGPVVDMSMDEYQAVDAMSASGLRQFARSPWHYRNRVQTAPTRPMLRGTLAHCAVLEPHAMSARYAVVPDDAPRRPSKAQWTAKKPSPESVLAMEWWTDFHRACEGREIISADEYAITEAQLEALARDEEIHSILTGPGLCECSLFWIDPATGVYCKARPDRIRSSPIGNVKVLDLKSTADESPAAFSRSAASLGYYLQRSHYTAGVQIACDWEVIDFVFAAVTSAHPVLAVPYRFIDEIVQQGDEEREELLARYAECMRTDRWPAYAPADRMIDLPKWAKPSKETEVSYVDD